MNEPSQSPQPWKINQTRYLVQDRWITLRADDCETHEGVSVAPYYLLEYPDWVNNRYLSLPASVPPRVRDLATEITSGLGTPYEKAKALEAYLRQYEYSLNVPIPPGDSDIVDYFLFELHLLQ